MDLSQMLQQAQRMKSDMDQAQSEIAELTRSFSVGGGVVTAVANGDGTLQQITIKPDAVDPEDVEALEDLVLEAANGALKAIRDAAQERMGSVTQGLDIPGLF